MVCEQLDFVQGRHHITGTLTQIGDKTTRPLPAGSPAPPTLGDHRRYPGPGEAS